MPRTISKTIRKQIVRRQLGKCANTSNVNLRGLEGYECPLWLSSNHNGYFDDSGYDIDHIVEYSISQDNSMDNLQALCKCCHGYKTIKFASNRTNKKRKKKNNKEIDELYDKTMDSLNDKLNYEKFKHLYSS